MGKKFADPFDVMFGPPVSRETIDADALLRALRRGPKTPAEVGEMFPGRAEAVVAAVRAAGHKIDSVAFCGETGWVWCLTENGRYCGVPGQRGVNVPPEDKRGLIPEDT